MPSRRVYLKFKQTFDIFRFWKKTHGTKTTDDNITVDAVASGSVDKTYTDSSSSGFSNKINGESTAVEVLSEKESDYNSDWDIFEETIIRDVNLETKSGQKCEHQLCCKISFLVKKVFLKNLMKFNHVCIFVETSGFLQFRF